MKTKRKEKIVISVNVSKDEADFLKNYSDKRGLNFSSVVDEIICTAVFKLKMEIETLKKLIMEDEGKK